jgi:isochorismate synthase
MFTEVRETDLVLQADVSAFWRSAVQLSFPSAMWRLPNENTRYFLTSFLDKPQQIKIDLDVLPPGFAVAPFMNPEGSQSYFLPADLLFSVNSSDNKKQFICQPNEFDRNWQEFREVLDEQQISEISLSTEAKILDDDASEKERFIESVEHAIRTIKRGELLKVVLSRKKTFEIADNYDINAIFDKLCKAYPTAFVSAIYLPHLNEVWLGASPEILVSQNADGIFKTVALAGTQLASTPEGRIVTEQDAAWRQKEIEEQALVSRYIINCFKKVRVREFDEFGPRTVQAGNLMHLRTVFTVDTKAINFPELTSVMLGLLHPTSAVCGMPKIPATQLIYETENYDREFYSGYLGPINIKQATNLFVNLRTMKLSKGFATLFAGCGITADSNPDKEWLETEMKCRTIENVAF